MKYCNLLPVGIIGSFVLGATLGNLWPWRDLKDEALQRGFAEHDAVTGEWRWKPAQLQPMDPAHPEYPTRLILRASQTTTNAETGEITYWVHGFYEDADPTNTPSTNRTEEP